LPEEAILKALFLLLLLVSPAAAQTPPATVTGRISDASRAGIPGAVVTLGNRGTVTNDEGRYIIRGLSPGSYLLTISAPGFAVYEASLAVDHGAHTHDATLEIAPMEERVLITEKAPSVENAVESWTDNVHANVDAREVRESGARDAGEALAALDGLGKIRKGGIANDVLLRGLAHDNINVLLDGARVNGACPNSMDPRAFHVDFSEIDRVEVTKGAFDLSNQGSLGGAINIVTKEPDGGLRFTPNIAAGSFGFYNPSFTGSYSGENVWALAGYSFRVSEPYRDGAGRPFTDYTNYRAGAAGTDAYRIHTGWFRAGGAPRPGQRVELSYTRQQSGQALYPYLMMDAGYDNADRLAVSWQAARAGAIHYLRAETYATRVKHWMTDEQRTSGAGTPLGYSMATFAETLTFGGKLSAEIGEGFSAGAEAYRRKWDGVNTSRMSGAYSSQHIIPDALSDVAGAYAQYQRSFTPRLRVTAAARLDGAATAASAADAVTDLYWAYKATRSTGTYDLMPSASLWAAYTRGRFDFFAGAGHTARIPDPVERYMSFARMGSDWVGNPELRPTRNTEADAGLTVRTRWFLLRPTVFYSYLADFVTVQNQARLVPGMGMAGTMARSFANVDARSYGGELTYSLGLGRQILLTGGAAMTRSIKDAAPRLKIFDRNVAEIPPLRAHSTLRYGTRLAFFETTFTAVAAQRRVDRDLLESPTPGYGVLDLKAGMHGKKLNVAVGIANVLDRFYYEHSSYQRDPFRSGVRVAEPGRNVFVTAQYRF
jgi:iron complex outermembrane receptor protein